jgi:hypothetical protein
MASGLVWENGSAGECISCGEGREPLASMKDGKDESPSLLPGARYESGMDFVQLADRRAHRR